MARSEKLELLTPAGRWVQGDPFEMQTKDKDGNLRVVKSGPNIGQPSPQMFVAIAIPKLINGAPNQEFAAFLAKVDPFARATWPHLFPAAPPANGRLFPIRGVEFLGDICISPKFTIKIKDGDGYDDNGKSNASKDGFAGCWVVSFASGYACKVVRSSGPNVWDTLTPEMRAIKRGDWCRISGTASGNNNNDNPGLYMNLDIFEWLGVGDEIVVGPDVATRLATPAYLPPGVSTVPTGGAAPPLPPGATTAPPPPPGATTPPPPATSGPVMTAKANGQTYDAMIKAGWTDATLVEHGYMTAPLVAPGAALNTGPTSTTISPSSPPPPPPYAGFMPGAKTMTAKANGQTYDAMIKAGWTDAMLVEHGYMTA